MAHTLTVNSSRSLLSTALVTSKSQPYSPSPFPDLSFGETVYFNLYITDGDQYDTRSGLAGYNPRIVITLADQKPESGVFTVSDNVDITSSLDYDASAAELEIALNEMNDGNGPFGDNVTVSKFQNGSYSILFNSDGDHPELSVDVSGLSPKSIASVLPLVNGTPTTREQQILQIQSEPLIFANSALPIDDGWRMSINANNSNLLQAVANGEISADYSIQLVDPSGSVDVLANGPLILKPKSFDIFALSGITYSEILTRDEVVNQDLEIVGLDGGTEADLNFIETVSLSINYTVLTGVVIGTSIPGKTWSLQSGTDANDPAGGVVRPLDFDEITNPKVWKVTQ